MAEIRMSRALAWPQLFGRGFPIRLLRGDRALVKANPLNGTEPKPLDPVKVLRFPTCQHANSHSEIVADGSASRNRSNV